MDKSKICLIVDVFAFLALLISATSGIMMWLRIGSSLQRIHAYASLTLVAIIIVHILLHYSWIKNMIFRSR